MKKIMTMLVTTGVTGAAMMGLAGNALAGNASPLHPTFKCPASDIVDDCRGPKDCLYPDPDDAGGYIQCNGAGMAYKMSCPADLWWNDTAKICDFPDNSTAPLSASSEE